MKMTRKPCAYFWFVGWDCWSLGLHVCTSMPNIEIHVPFGFFRIGFEGWFDAPALNPEVRQARMFGFGS